MKLEDSLVDNMTYTSTAISHIHFYRSIQFLKITVVLAIRK